MADQIPANEWAVQYSDGRRKAALFTESDALKYAKYTGAVAIWHASTGWRSVEAVEDGACPHCPDGHKPPDRQPWSAWVTEARDGDGQPTTIHVARSNGAHVAESDAQWIRDVLNHRIPNGLAVTQPTTTTGA